MRVLLIEDNDRKREAIRTHVESILKSVIWEEAPSYHVGLDRVLVGDIDLVLLDMTIPIYEDQHDGHKSPMWIYGGEELLRQVKRKRIATKVIIVTAFDYFDDGKLSRKLKDLEEALDKFRPFYQGTVLYGSGERDWKQSLAELLTGLT